MLRTLDTTYLHNAMILSTLSLNPHGFVLGLSPKGLISMEIFVHPYMPMILPTSNQCGTLFVYPTILPSNKGPSSLPSNDYPSAGFSPLYQPGFSAPMRWKHTPYMVAPPVSRACSIPGQLLFTVFVYPTDSYSKCCMS